MLSSLAKKIFGSANDRLVVNLQREVAAINAMEAEIAALTDAQLRAKTDEFRAALEAGAKLDSLLIPAFAVVREASKRVLGMRHFDVQLVGGMVLHKGMIAEMKTGEGKTLVATLPSYLNALSGKGVHIVTVNDYLARRDAAWMGKIHQFLGLTVGVIVHGIDDRERHAAYACDITYGTNNEYGFDYLRDNMKYSRAQMVQRPFNFAIVDEVDSILIDEARTPLIISGPTEDNSELYTQIDKYMPRLMREHADILKSEAAAPEAAKDTPYMPGGKPEARGLFEVDEKSRSSNLTERGVARLEEMLTEAGVLKDGAGLYDIENVSIVHHVNQALKAHTLFKRDTDYIVKDRRVVIIDEFTGRMMEGRRYSDGLHQALEAKENAIIENENQTLASITFQNYFRLFPKLAGMTGTAMTEAGEFNDIYKLDVIEIPTHVPVARRDEHDEIYRTSEERDRAVVLLIAQAHARQQPVLVGTVSIEKSESLSARLSDKKFILSLVAQLKKSAETLVDTAKSQNDKAREDAKKASEEMLTDAAYLEKIARNTPPIPHQVLNARYHEQEASIIAQAGRPGAVTIATNMAGRGTDIKLGGSDEMLIEQQSASITDVAELQKIAERIRAEVVANKEIVIKAGGLYVICTERHESRRIDNQLRGRSGRQGDPGASKFFLSLQDDLMRIFGSERIDSVLTKLGLQEGEAIIHSWMNKAIERAQTKVEQRNYEIRKTLLKYDDVMNDQRKVIYEQRIELMETDNVHDTITEMRADVAQHLVQLHIPPQSYAEAWDAVALRRELLRVFGLDLPVELWAAEEGIADGEILERTHAAVEKLFAEKEASFPPAVYAMAEKRVLLETLDQLWKDHLLTLDHLRQGINLRAYAQRDPLNEYKQEAFSLFEQMLNHLREVVVSRLARMQIRVELTDEIMNLKPQQVMRESRTDPAMALEAPPASAQMLRMNVPATERIAADPATWGKVARNEACPCGSGKKYKHCHGALA
ncbi:MAG: preprotein translocase subunit SecA [Rickettsiales bacterium]